MKGNTRSKDGWSRVRFGDVVLNSTAVSRDPSREGFTRYIIGKHIEENRSRVESWGDVGDPDFGPRIRTIVLPGDVLCTTRGPKLKVATVDFRGLGAHTNFVLRTRNPDVLLQSYLEAIVRSDSFQQHLAKHFRGSVNLFVNWSDAALYEFDLPPIERQEALSRDFAAMSGCIDAQAAVVQGARALVRSSLTDVFQLVGVRRRDQIKAPRGWRLMALRELADPHRPISYGVLKPGPESADGVPMLRVMDFDEFGRRSSTQVYRISKTVADTSKTTYCQSGDLVVSIMATIGRAFVTSREMNGWNMNRALALIPCNSTNTAAFLHAYFQSGAVQRLLGEEKIGSAQARINLADLKTLPVPVPPELDTILSVSSAVMNTLIAAENRLSSTRSFANALLSGVLT